MAAVQWDMLVLSRRRLLAMLSAFPPAARLLTAQEKPQGATFSADVNVVNLFATVRGKDGRIVSNLNAEDFVLLEDGRPQSIRYFSRETDLPLTLGLLVDTSMSQRHVLPEERSASYSFFEHGLRQDKDQAFVLHFDREVELLRDFTDSRDKLDHEIDQMGPTSQERNNQGPETSGDNRGNGQSRNSRGGGTQLYDAIYLASDELMKRQEGRKALVVFSDGADHGSKETLNDAIDAADRANLQVFTIYFKGEEERPQNGNPGGRRGGMGGGYPGGGYPGGYPGGGGGYPGGGGGGRRGPASESGVDGKKIMQQIASRTGGQFFEAKKKDNLEDIYGLIAGALRQQYLLTYTPDKVDTDEAFHKIALKTDKSDLTVITREGYYSATVDK